MSRHRSLEIIIEQMKAVDGVREDMKQHDQLAWVGIMNNIRNRVEEIIIKNIKTLSQNKRA